MFEDTECTRCVLHKRAKHRCLPSVGDQDCTLAIFLDYPTLVDDRRGRSFSSDNAEFVRFCLKRMSVPLEAVYLDYIVKCYPVKMPGKKDERMACVRECSTYRTESIEQLTHLKAMVVLGSLGCEMITTDKTVGHKAGAEWAPISPMLRQHIDHVWIGMSPGVLAEKPSEAGSIYRVIWMAAEEAGLHPKVAKIAPYEFKL